MNDLKTKLLHLTEKYYRVWGDKDIIALQSMLSNDIVLVDPIVGRVEGLENVLIENENIFSECISLAITSQNIYVDYFTNKTIGEIIISCNGKLINVVDIFLFDDRLKIKNIIAYLDTNQ